MPSSVAICRCVIFPAAVNAHTRPRNSSLSGGLFRSTSRNNSKAPARRSWQSDWGSSDIRRRGKQARSSGCPPSHRRYGKTTMRRISCAAVGRTREMSPPPFQRPGRSTALSLPLTESLGGHSQCVPDPAAPTLRRESRTTFVQEKWEYNGWTGKLLAASARRFRQDHHRVSH